MCSFSKSDLSQMEKECRESYDNACQYKELARKEPRNGKLFQQAAKCDECASKLANKLAMQIGNGAGGENYKALSDYYCFEALDCQSAYLTQDRNYTGALAVVCKAEEKLRDAVDKLTMSQDQDFKCMNMNVWQFLLYTKGADIWELKARIHQEKHEFMEASDCYQLAGDKYKIAHDYISGNLVDMANSPSEGDGTPAYRRLSRSNELASKCNSIIMRFYYARENGHIEQALTYLLQALDIGAEVNVVNPEWRPNINKAQELRDIAYSFLSDHKSEWKIFLRSSNQTIIRELMKEADSAYYAQNIQEAGGNIVNNNFNGTVNIHNQNGNVNIGNNNVNIENNEIETEPIDELVKKLKSELPPEILQQIQSLHQEMETSFLDDDENRRKSILNRISSLIKSNDAGAKLLSKTADVATLLPLLKSLVGAS